jgi:hypothetical protein
MFHCFPRLLALLLLTITSLGLSSHASAQVRPFHATGIAQFAPNQSDFTGSGHATHLGKYTEVGNVTFAPTSTPGVVSATGWTHYTAANGDQLHAVIAGTVNMVTGAIAATATYVGGTGRFTNASGASTLVGQMLGGGALTIAANGSISY